MKLKSSPKKNNALADGDLVKSPLPDTVVFEQDSASSPGLVLTFKRLIELGMADD